MPSDIALNYEALIDGGNLIKGCLVELSICTSHQVVIYDSFDEGRCGRKQLGKYLSDLDGDRREQVQKLIPHLKEFVVAVPEGWGFNLSPLGEVLAHQWVYSPDQIIPLISSIQARAGLEKAKAERCRGDAEANVTSEINSAAISPLGRDILELIRNSGTVWEKDGQVAAGLNISPDSRFRGEMSLLRKIGLIPKRWGAAGG